jgi:hypothetical protein
MTVLDKHNQAMAAAEGAFVARMRGDTEQADYLLRSAYEAERSAAEMLADQLANEPSRSVLYRSAATLAYDCGEHRAAERLAAAGLAGEPPDEIAQELRDLFEQINARRHLSLRGIVLLPQEIQLEISGNGIGSDFGLGDELTGRIDITKKMVARCAERRRGHPYRESGRPVSSVARDTELYISSPRPGCMAMTLRFGVPEDQLRLEETEDRPGIIDEFLAYIELAGRAAYRELRDGIANEAYYRNFVGLARLLMPDGDRVKMVGFTAIRDGRERYVALDKTRRELPPPEPLETEISEDGEVVRVTGVLKEANANKKHQISIVGDDSRTFTVDVPMGMMRDIVRPHFDDVVRVTGHRLGPKKIRLLDIEPA